MLFGSKSGAKVLLLFHQHKGKVHFVQETDVFS